MSLGPSLITVRREPASMTVVEADVCVVGAGIAGISAALESARLGRKVVLVDAEPALGGQAVGAIIGTFCGLFSNGPEPYQVTHGIADDILRDLGAADAINLMRGRRNTVIVQYNEVALGRWIENQVHAAGISVLLGAVLRDVEREGPRVTRLGLATRHGDVTVEAGGFVDASGNAALCWQAGLDCQQPDAPLYGTTMFVMEGVDEAAAANIARPEFEKRLKAKADDYGLIRQDGFAFAFPGRGTALVNMTHVETPLDPLGASAMVLEGRAQADRVFAYLRSEYAEAFGGASIRAYGLPGVRQTRWIKGAHHLTEEEVRSGHRHADAIARCSWPIEIHHRVDSAHWDEFGDDHMHYVPLGSLTPDGLDNVMAAGRCIDGDAVALSSVRVMGPCIAMGAAAAHALDLAGSGSVHQLDVAALQARLHDNLERTD